MALSRALAPNNLSVSSSHCWFVSLSIDWSSDPIGNIIRGLVTVVLLFPADIAPFTHDTVSVGALVYRVSVTALGALGVHPAAASGVVGGQEVVGHLLVVDVAGAIELLFTEL